MDQLIREAHVAWPVWRDGVKSFRDIHLVLDLTHAVYVAYAYRTIAPLSEQFGPRSFLRGVLSTLLLGMGGGTVAALITGRPVPWLVSNELIPIYIAGYVIVCQDPTDLVFSLLNLFQPATGFLFELVDAIVRAFAMASAVDHLRKVSHPAAPTSFVGQIIVGTLGVTAGGIIWKWSKRPGEAFKYPGWDFSVIAFATSVYVLCTGGKAGPRFMEYVNAMLIPRSPQTFVVELVTKGFIPRVREAATILGVPKRLSQDDWRYISTAIILVGFLLRPLMSPAVAPAVTRRRAVRSQQSHHNEHHDEDGHEEKKDK